MINPTRYTHSSHHWYTPLFVVLLLDFALNVIFPILKSTVQCDLAALLYSLVDYIHATQICTILHSVKHPMHISPNHHNYHRFSIITYRQVATLQPYYLGTIYKPREVMVKYTPVTAISLSLKMPASDNPYKFLRANIPAVYIYYSWYLWRNSRFILLPDMSMV